MRVFSVVSLLILAVACCIVWGCEGEHSEVTSTGPVGPVEFPPLRRLDTDPRLAVVKESLAALGGFDQKSTKQISGNAVGDWGYLIDDENARNVVKGWYGSNASVQSDFYTTAVCKYAVRDADCYGRCGQCVFFVNLILYRSGTYQTKLPSYATCYQDFLKTTRAYTKPVSQAKVGDIIRTKTTNGHTAIVVKILAGTEGKSVTSVDVIDCNFVGGNGNEIIGRHEINTNGQGTGDLDSYYAVDLIKLGAN